MVMNVMNEWWLVGLVGLFLPLPHFKCDRLTPEFFLLALPPSFVIIVCILHCAAPEETILVEHPNEDLTAGIVLRFACNKLPGFSTSVWGQTSEDGLHAFVVVAEAESSSSSHVVDINRRPEPRKVLEGHGSVPIRTTPTTGKALADP